MQERGKVALEAGLLHGLEHLLVDLCQLIQANLMDLRRA